MELLFLLYLFERQIIVYLSFNQIYYLKKMSSHDTSPQNKYLGQTLCQDKKIRIIYFEGGI